MYDLLNCDVLTYHHGICPVATVTLGPYSLSEGMYINCCLRCPLGHNDSTLPVDADQVQSSKKPKLSRRTWHDN